ncbi:TPA: hypothetical protein NJ925_004659 [Vibrio parahaemolyticus]|uniref:Uncharacterized protein n=1 Tax=Vibrio xiamenensis TaxID=861298 RepID=A0A1G8CDN5_9VIBR|nr:hypothetical protein [Vibrio xiamenensis]SDH43293.1 hypothetical protein SAMN04488136_1161 [Vibrio xiamenensis]HCG9862106.1 hypothetical protein [Vibrio parahaemolyticus]HCH3511568.1 hypothetical protein [Vibrio parahaemolyticus]HCH4317882.1 hypothetical protein [Vibrio parahaemolyticus]
MGDIFGSNSGDSGVSDSSYQQQQESEQNTYSQRTMAQMRDTQAQYERTQQSMALDLARNSGDNPQAMLDTMVEMKDNQRRMDELAAKIQDNVSDFNQHDFNDMRERRKNGQTDVQIAISYATNASFVNRRINGK